MQEMIVALIVLCAAFVVAKRYLPRSLKQSLNARFAGFAHRHGWTKLEHRLQTASQSVGGCGDGCGSCGGCAPSSTDSASREQPIVFKKR